MVKLRNKFNETDEKIRNTLRHIHNSIIIFNYINIVMV